MPISRSDETDLILPLHDGVHGDTTDQRPWRLFLSRLRRRLRAEAVTIDVRPGGEDEPVRFAAGARGAAPFGAWHASLRAGRVYALAERARAVPGVGRVVRADEPGGASAWLSVWRDGAEFSAADGALLGALAPHLAVALRTRVALDGQRAQAAVDQAALARAGIGWVTLSRDARVLALSDDAATALSAATGVGRWTGERLAPARRDDAATIAAFCLAPAGVRAVTIGEAMPLAMLLAPPPFLDAPTVPTIAAIGLIAAPNMRDTGWATALADLYALAPSEARFAAAIGAGASIADAAAALGLTIETARNYSKRIYAKTRTAGQVDLVRVIGEGVVRLG